MTRASYVVSPEKTYWVTTINYINEYAQIDTIESGIRDYSRVQDGKIYRYGELDFTLCNHDIWPLEDGHKAVVQALKDGIEPADVYEHLRRAALPRSTYDQRRVDPASKGAAVRPHLFGGGICAPSRVQAIDKRRRWL